MIQEKTHFHTHECALVNGENYCSCGGEPELKKKEAPSANERNSGSGLVDLGSTPIRGDSGKGQEDVSENSEQGVNNATPETKAESLDTPLPPEKSDEWWKKKSST